MSLSETDKAYMAALVDGEGSVVITHRRGGAHILRLTIEMCDEYPPLWCLQKTGLGFLSKRTPPLGFAHHQRLLMYAWRVQGQAVIDVLDAIEPYLKIKRRQARLAHLMYESVRKSPKLSMRQITDGAMACLEMQKANGRGAREPRPCSFLSRLKTVDATRAEQQLP